MARYNMGMWWIEKQSIHHMPAFILFFAFRRYFLDGPSCTVVPTPVPETEEGLLVIKRSVPP